MLLDAAGNAPAPLTEHEKSWATAVGSGAVQAANDELTRRHALPLSEKIDMTLARIKDWYEAWEGKVSVSYSGGKESSLLQHLVRKLYPDVPAVFCNTGLEYPEVVKAVKNTPNHVVLRPKMSFREVIQKYGWPIASKSVARGIHVLRNPTGKNQNTYRLYDLGIDRFGDPAPSFKVPKQWRFLVDAPFSVSDMCCAIMKEGPLDAYEKATGRKPFIGTLAVDSKRRRRDYLKSGCNSYDSKNPKSKPLSFWGEQDVLAALVLLRIPIPEVYGQIVRCEDGMLRTTGVRRTGCTFCCFGLHMETYPNRFEQMAVTHPRLYAYCMDRLGLRDVLHYCRDNAPARLAKQFRWEHPCVSQGTCGMECL